MQSRSLMVLFGTKVVVTGRPGCGDFQCKFTESRVEKLTLGFVIVMRQRSSSAKEKKVFTANCPAKSFVFSLFYFPQCGLGKVTHVKCVPTTPTNGSRGLKSTSLCFLFCSLLSLGPQPDK